MRYLYIFIFSILFIGCTQQPQNGMNKNNMKDKSAVIQMFNDDDNWIPINQNTKFDKVVR